MPAVLLEWFCTNGIDYFLVELSRSTNQMCTEFGNAYKVAKGKGVFTSYDHCDAECGQDLLLSIVGKAVKEAVSRARR